MAHWGTVCKMCKDKGVVIYQGKTVNCPNCNLNGKKKK